MCANLLSTISHKIVITQLGRAPLGPKCKGKIVINLIFIYFYNSPKSFVNFEKRKHDFVLR